ncbi:MAG: serine protease [Acidobacteriota bacterium]
MNAERPCRVLFMILTLGLPSILPTEGAYAQKAQGTTTARQAPTTLAATEIARRTLPAVVMIECANADEASQASGFLILPGIVVTNYHVIKNMEKGTIKVVDGRLKGSKKFRITAVLAVDERTDLALLGVLEAKRAGISMLPLAQGNAVIGETVYAFGNPEGLSGTMSPGIVSSALRVLNGKPLLQITAPISHGSSGGPVVNSRGQVVGIAVGSVTEGQNLNFAVPASLITSLVTKWESGNSGGFESNIWDLIEPSEGAVEGAWTWLASPAQGTGSVPKTAQLLPRPWSKGSPEPSGAANNPAGSYKGIFKFGEGHMKDAYVSVTVEIKNDNGKLSGSINTPQGPAPIISGTYAAGQVRLKFDVGGNEGTVTAHATDRLIIGQWTLTGESGTLELERSGAALSSVIDPISGEWNATADAQGTPIAFTLRLRVKGDEVTGETSTIQGTNPIVKGAWTAQKLSLALDTPSGRITLTGALKDGKLVGHFDFAGQLQGNWEAIKKK